MPGNPSKIVQFQYKKGQSGNPGGRPQKYLSKLKALGYTKIEIHDTIRVILSLSFAELQKVATSPDATVLEVLITNALIKSIIKGDLQALDILLTRTFGYAHQSVKIDEEIHATVEIKFED